MSSEPRARAISNGVRSVVINGCFGGFGLSEAGMRAYAEKRGCTLYPEKDTLFTTYWLAPPNERTGILEGDDFAHATMDERQQSNERCRELQLYDGDLERDDVDLVAVVRELGSVANGDFAKLHVVDIPEDAAWEISDYDGMEHIAESHRTWS